MTPLNLFILIFYITFTFKRKNTCLISSVSLMAFGTNKTPQSPCLIKKFLQLFMNHAYNLIHYVALMEINRKGW